MGVETLIEQLKTVPDWRRGRAVQYPLWLMLLMTLLGVMSGYSSLRGLADFMARHQQEVADHFGLAKMKLPSYPTLRRMGRSIVEVGEAVAIDGKALASTMQECFGNQQDFVMVVSACVQSGSGVMGQVRFQNGKSSEIGAVQRQGVREGHNFHRHSWFILSQVIPAKQAAALIRNHCGSIENKLHWVKDAVQGEDDAAIRAANPAKLLALLRSWAISSFRNAGYDSLTKAMRLFKHDLPKLLSFL